MSKKIDITGFKYGKLTVICQAERTDSDQGKTKWWCRCECGKEKSIESYGLRRGLVVSCGCSRGSFEKSHGMARTIMYRKWSDIKRRCTNKNSRKYRDYGGRGITMCSDWIESFESFRDWSMKNGYSDDLEIDRIDNNKGYSPENCRYITHQKNVNNKRNNVNIEIDGVIKTASEWAVDIGATPAVIYNRLKRGDTGTDLIRPPDRNKRKRKRMNKHDDQADRPTDIHSSGEDCKSKR
ncbi:hypothetical protein [Paenibacillus apii]|uniref:hypothetical protein n=1 Tax=Paenibacillus apii TaxID=1850370 RepID=UPI00143A3E35|nr:hypothetical protein [Paenibacillus apii]NJJ38579.1 hypothetical protein [Paenibacillus apii]